jgi:hypothetical protein
LHSDDLIITYTWLKPKAIYKVDWERRAKCQAISKAGSETTGMSKWLSPGPKGSVNRENSHFLHYRKVSSEKADPKYIVYTHGL